MARTSYAIALGSNMRGRRGSPAANVRAAAEALGVRTLSKIHMTEAVGPAGRGFANAAAIVERDLEPDTFLAELKRLERAFGRRAGRRWGPRVLDLDIILWSGGTWGGPGPIVPHAAFRERTFVLAPLAEIAPGWRDPMSGHTIRQLLARLTRPRPTPR